MSGYDPKSIRTASVARKTGETDIQCSITLDHAPDTQQVIQVNTGIGFLNHVRSVAPDRSSIDGGADHQASPCSGGRCRCSMPSPSTAA